MSNAATANRCSRCRAPLSASAGRPAPVLSRGGAARLAWRATKFLTRAGLVIAIRSARAGIQSIRAARSQDVKRETIDGEFIVPAEPPARTTRPLEDWRVWTNSPDARSDPDSPSSGGPGWERRKR